MRKLPSNKFGRISGLRLLLVLASALMLAKPAPASPPAQYSLAVLPLEAAGRISPREASTLTSRLVAELGKTGIFTITEQAVVEATLQTAGLLEAGCSSVECGKQAGKLLSTQLVVNGSVRKVGQLYFIEVQMIHTNSGSVLQKVSEDFDGSFERLQNFMATVARKLVGKTSGSASTVSSIQKTSAIEQSTAASERSGSETAGDTSGSSEKTTEVKRGSNKFLVIGAVAAGAIGAGVLITQATKDSGSKKPPDNTLTELPGPPKFP
ncbi:MAG: hypothetical protein ONB44_24675 [candidate division KSB1 bacterium]|nr:hypothetical protein [candidate division KSB1 bacterium]MDZ7305332.1 hypothetical protein [candidate division KSB1 bacterium]